MWEYTGNGHNDTMWFPGFMLASFDNVKNMVVKCLTVAVGLYLKEGLSVMNYN